MAVCRDPAGAVFGLWEAKRAGGIDVDSHAQGAPSWFETLTPEPARVVPFYAALFGWTAEPQSMPDGATYTRFKLGGVPVAGAMSPPPRAAGVPAHWGTYFAVDDAVATARRGVELGAELCIPVTDIPGVGRFALFKSPQGVSFHLIEYTRRSCDGFGM